MKLPTGKTRSWVILLVEAGLFLVLVLTMRWLWDRWLILGPNGPLHWVGMDFVPYWVGVRAMLSGQSPYDAATTHAIQSALLGGPPAAGGDPMLFVYPAWIFLLLVPLALVPLPWAVALWTGALLFGVLHLIGYLAIRWGGERLLNNALWSAVLVVGCLPYLAISVTKGQFGLVGLGALLGTNRLRKRYELLAGVVLGFAILKPTLTIIPMAGYLLWAVIERKWRMLVGFAACMGILLIASLLVVGNWIPDYLTILNTTGGAPILWSWTILPSPWNVIYVLFFTGLVIYAFTILCHKHNQAMWFSTTVLAGLALFPMRWIYDLLLGILVPAEAQNIKGLFAVVVVVALIAPWGLALFPPELRWNAQVVGLPLFWAAACLAQLFFCKFD
jgi:hypothetical protein